MEGKGVMGVTDEESRLRRLLGPDARRGSVGRTDEETLLNG